MSSIGVPAIVERLRGPALGRWLRVVGPAWIVMLADVDAPSVITAAKGGTESGYALLLPVFAVVPVLFLVQEMTARLALATGMGHAELVHARYGRRWAAVSVIGMAVINFVAYVAEFAGIALGAAIVGIPAPVAIVGALAIHASMVLSGGYSRFERLALVLSLALFSFVVLAVAGRPDLGHLVSDLSPLPSDVPHDYFALVVAMIGASIMPWMLFYQQSASVDKKLTREDLHGSRVETLLGALASQALMAAVVIAAAAAMQSAGPVSAGARNLAELPEGLARLADGGAGWLIALGLVGSGLLALVVVSLSAAWGIGELMGWPRSLNLKFSQARRFYGVYFVEVVPAAAIALMSADLVRLCVGAMVFNVIILALPLAFLVRLTSDRGLLGDLANSRPRAALLWVVVVTLLAAGIFGMIQYLT
ncbi:MAG: divalent metal cation transporter [Candidatus Limnocylindrales bacterium]|jgi:Mn2+/Fe2+ NRAMP family transporter